jgi:hypothetical protein
LVKNNTKNKHGFTALEPWKWVLIFFLNAGSDSSYNKCGSAAYPGRENRLRYLNMSAVKIHVGLGLTVRPVGVFPNRIPFQSSFSPIDNTYKDSMFLMDMVCTGVKKIQVTNQIFLEKALKEEGSGKETELKGTVSRDGFGC